MATMNVSLPDEMKAWVESRAGTGRYSNASDYVRDLIREDQERAMAMAKLDEIVEQALASGISTRSMDEILDEARDRWARRSKNAV